MLKSLIGSLLLAAVVLAGSGKDPKDGPRANPLVRTVTPEAAKAGDTLTIGGENLEKANVAEVYLTTGPDNFKLTVITQTGTQIEAKVPANVKSGRLRLMLLTAGVEPQYLELPLVVEIE